MVVIPNENDLLKLSKMQKEVCNILKASDNVNFAIPAQPLWLHSETPFDCSEEELKNEGKKIVSLIIQDFCIEESEKYFNIKCRAEVNCTESKKYFLMPFVIFKTNKISENQKKEIEEFFKKELPLSLKIFRLGIEHYESPNAMSISSSVWVKLK